MANYHESKANRAFVVSTAPNTASCVDEIVTHYLAKHREIPRNIWDAADGSSFAYSLEYINPELIELLETQKNVIIYKGAVPNNDIKQFDSAIAFGAQNYNKAYGNKQKRNQFVKDDEKFIL